MQLLLVACQHFCISLYFSLSVNSLEENDVLQHASTHCSEEPGRDSVKSDREEEISAAVA